LEALCEGAVIGLSGARLVGRITGRENVAERSRLMAKLDEERRKQCVAILFSSILEIKEEVSDVG